MKRRRAGLQVWHSRSYFLHPTLGKTESQTCPCDRWRSECRDSTKFVPVCILCSVLIIYIQFCDAQMMTREAPSSSGLKHKTSMRDYWNDGLLSWCLHLQYVFFLFRFVFKLYIVRVLSANALECIPLEIFLRSGLAPVRAKCPY